jgi:hypothetical protein
VRVERRLVGPQLQEDERIRVEGTLKDLVLQAAGLLLHSTAAVGHGLSEFRPFSGFGVCSNDESHRHRSFLSCCA